MRSAVISRAWRGETPYIASWLRYHLDNLGFDAAIILRCDNERFDFVSEEFGDRVRFVDRPAYCGEGVFDSLVKYRIPDDFEYVFSCDIDEFLILHGKTIREFLEGKTWDSCFLWWALCCSTDPCSGDLRNNTAGGVSFGHDGKTIFRTSKAVAFHNEHHVDMQPGSELWFERQGVEDVPFVLHMCSRGFEDLMVRSLGQLIKVDAFENRYLSCLERPPNDFRRLPLRFKVAHLQSKMQKMPFSCALPSLPVDSERLKALFAETEAPMDNRLFGVTYKVDDLLEEYPRSLDGFQRDFNEVVMEAEALRQLRSII
jgi:hypothetical protein